MPLLQLVMVLIVVGVVLWLINRFIPMQGTIHPERGSSNSGSSLAPEYFRALQFLRPYPRRLIATSAPREGN
jgi:hypothetical protein